MVGTPADGELFSLRVAPQPEAERVAATLPHPAPTEGAAHGLVIVLRGLRARAGHAVESSMLGHPLP